MFTQENIKLSNTQNCALCISSANAGSPEKDGLVVMEFTETHLMDCDDKTTLLMLLRNCPSPVELK